MADFGERTMMELGDGVILNSNSSSSSSIYRVYIYIYIYKVILSFPAVYMIVGLEWDGFATTPLSWETIRDTFWGRTTWSEC